MGSNDHTVTLSWCTSGTRITGAVIRGMWPTAVTRRGKSGEAIREIHKTLKAGLPLWGNKQDKIKKR